MYLRKHDHTKVNHYAFHGSGIYPIDASKAGIKIAPSKIFCNTSNEATTSKHSAALEALETQMSTEIKVKLNFAERLANRGT